MIPTFREDVSGFRFTLVLCAGTSLILPDTIPNPAEGGGAKLLPGQGANLADNCVSETRACMAQRGFTEIVCWGCQRPGRDIPVTANLSTLKSRSEMMFESHTAKDNLWVSIIWPR